MLRPGLWISHSAKKIANTDAPAHAATAGLLLAFSYCMSHSVSVNMSPSHIGGVRKHNKFQIVDLHLFGYFTENAFKPDLLLVTSSLTYEVACTRYIE